jgi:hypothetical protein
MYYEVSLPPIGNIMKTLDKFLNGINERTLNIALLLLCMAAAPLLMWLIVEEVTR